MGPSTRIVYRRCAEKLTVLTVQDIAIIDGPGYQLSDGETTKRAAEASVFNRHRSHRAGSGWDHLSDQSWPGLMFLAGRFDEIGPGGGVLLGTTVQRRQG